MRESTATFHLLMAGRHLRRGLQFQITLGGQLLNETVQQLAQLLLRFLVAVAPERLQQLGSELAAFDQGVENCLTKRFDGAIRLRVEIVEIRIEALSGRKSRLQQKISELVEQSLKIDRISRFRAELRVGVEAHLSKIQRGHKPCIIQWNG